MLSLRNFEVNFHQKFNIVWHDPKKQIPNAHNQPKQYFQRMMQNQKDLHSIFEIISTQHSHSKTQL